MSRSRKEGKMAKLVSVMGDSISTYDGYNPLGYWVYYCGEMCEINGLSDVSDTWWMQVIRTMRAKLCVNASYSGSRVSGAMFPAATSDKRIRALRGAEGGSNPDVILIYMGVNDYLNGIPTRRDPAPPQKGLAHFFEESYNCLLHKLKAEFPSSDVVCATLMRTTMRDHEYWAFPERCGDASFEEYNDAIRKAAMSNGCMLADLANQGMAYETLDSIHPTAAGHTTIARAWLAALEG